MRIPHAFEAIIDYAESMSSPPGPLLDQLERETHLKMLSPQMVSGRHLGRFLSFISRLRSPQVIFEFGTFTGYATFCLLEGLAPGGKLFTFEANRETTWLFKKYKDLLDKEDRVTQFLGDALEKMDEVKEVPDLVWIDAGKRLNREIFDRIISRMKPGGMVMIDNTLWSGRVLDDDDDERTQAVRDFNTYLRDEEKVDTFFVPIRDGVTITMIK